jgi:hypothetical protein
MKGGDRKTRRLPRFASTMHSVNRWYVAEVNKLGWVVLSKARGDMSRIAEYKRSIHRLEQVIGHLMSEYYNSDRQHDLNVLRMNVEVLAGFVKSHL